MFGVLQTRWIQPLKPKKKPIELGLLKSSLQTERADTGWLLCFCVRDLPGGWVRCTGAPSAATRSASDTFFGEREVRKALGESKGRGIVQEIFYKSDVDLFFVRHEELFQEFLDPYLGLGVCGENILEIRLVPSELHEVGLDV